MLLWIGNFKENYLIQGRDLEVKGKGMRINKQPKIINEVKSIKSIEELARWEEGKSKLMQLLIKIFGY